MKILNIVWDLDGTILDTYPAIVKAMLMALTDLRVDVDPIRLDRMTRQSIAETMTILSVEKKIDVDEFLTRFQAYNRNAAIADQPVFPGIIPVLQWVLDQGGRNVIGTHRGRATTERLLRGHQIEHFFADWFTDDDGFARKPAPDMFVALLEKHNLRSIETLAVGDRDLDILAGKAAGMRTCAYGQGDFTSSPDYKIDNYGALLNILEELDNDCC
jgi:HAD superfamily hydrolase (TIGR01509 family)